MAQQIITLNPGESEIASFTVTPNEAKTYTVSVDGLGGTFVVLPKGLPEVPEEFCVDTINAEPSVVVLGNEVKIHVQYWLPNGVDVRPYIGKTYQMHCTIDGETLTASTGPIPYFPATIDFAYTPQSIGTYTATVLDKSVSFEVRAEVVGAYYNPYGGYEIYSSIDELANYINNNRLGETTDCFQGNCWWIQNCPYCDYSLKAGYYYARNPSDTLKNVYGVLDHIQSSHPEYPLTKPRPHVEVTVPQLPSPVTGVWISPGAYYVVIDGMCSEIGYFKPGGANMWVFNNVGLFATLPGTHHIEVGGPLRRGCWDRARMLRLGQELPTLFSQDVTLQAVGDKVTIDAGTGLTGYKEWMVPAG